MTLFRSRTVAFTVQVGYWILRVVAPAELVNHVKIDIIHLLGYGFTTRVGMTSLLLLLGVKVVS